MKTRTKTILFVLILIFAGYTFLLGTMTGLKLVENGRRVKGVYQIRTVIMNGDTIKADTSRKFLKYDHPALSDTILNPKI